MLTKFKSKTLSSIFIILQALQKRRKFQLIYLTIFMVLAAFSEVFSLVSFIPFITSLSNPDKIQNLPYVIDNFNFINDLTPQNLILISTFIFSLSVLAAGTLRLLTVSFTYNLTALIGTDIMSTCLDRIYNQPYSNFINRNSSETVHLAVIQVNDAVYVILNCLQLVASSILFIALTSTMLVINFKLTLLAFLLFVSIYIFIILKFKSKIFSYSKQIDEIKKWQMQLLTEMNGSIRDVILVIQD